MLGPSSLGAGNQNKDTDTGDNGIDTSTPRGIEAPEGSSLTTRKNGTEST